MNRHKFPCGCVFSDGHESFGGQLSFCPLHAAASDLLATCEFTLPALEWAATHMDGNMVQFNDCLAVLRAAIAKAKGGAR